MNIKSLRHNSQGIAAVAIVAVIVVVAVIAVAAVLVSKHQSNTKTVVQKSDTSSSATKSISGVTFASSLEQLMPKAFTAEELTAANSTQEKNIGTQFFNAAGGYTIPKSDTTAYTIEWGKSLRTLSIGDFKSFITKSFTALGTASSDVQIDQIANGTLKTSDGSSPAQCFNVNAKIQGETTYSTFCTANVQKSTVYASASGANNTESLKGINDLFANSTLTLQ